MKLFCALLLLSAGTVRAAGPAVTPEAIRTAGQAGFGFSGLKEIQKGRGEVPGIEKTSPAAPVDPAVPAGRYTEIFGGGERIIIDADGRLRTNIGVLTANGVMGALKIPGVLRWDDLNGRFTGKAGFSVNFTLLDGRRLTCTWRDITLEAEFSRQGDALDVNFNHAQSYYLDVYDRCLAVGRNRTEFSFERSEQAGDARDTQAAPSIRASTLPAGVRASQLPTTSID
ncbi:MAG: hypothetical protein HYZ75_17400 [Elusimicrobia bacterium]|nr:hypothetical protein [Elusimicrobiota bacterium]